MLGRISQVQGKEVSHARSLLLLTAETPSLLATRDQLWKAGVVVFGDVKLLNGTTISNEYMVLGQRRQGIRWRGRAANISASACFIQTLRGLPVFAPSV